MLPGHNKAIHGHKSPVASSLSPPTSFHTNNENDSRKLKGLDDYDYDNVDGKATSNSSIQLSFRSSVPYSSSPPSTEPVVPNKSNYVVNIGSNGSNEDMDDDYMREESNDHTFLSLRLISHRSGYVQLLRLIWCLVLAVGEHGTFWAMVHRCSWPENSSWDASSQSPKDRYRVALIADPQLTDWYSYGQSGVLLGLVQMYTDIYMRRSFRRLHASLRPDAVLFLGDLNDGGRGSQSQVFEDNLHRFYERVFETKSTAWNQEPILMDAVPEEGNVNRVEESGNSVNVTGQYRQIKDIPETAADRETLREAGKSLRLYVAGNHDVGFGDTLIRPSMVRYKKVFGSVNYEIEVGNHTLVVLDTLSLSSNNPEIRQESQSFLNQMEQEAPTLPRILFTHVPLFRADTTYCGDVRETKQLILNRGGFQFWNMVNAKLSREILRGIQPDVVFSGDDHDWCEIAHSLDGIVTPEVTLRSFSFAQGIQQPAFVMLSLFNPDHTAKNTFPVIPGAGMALGGNESEGTSATVTRPTGKSTFVYGECMLPNQMMIYMSYGAIFVITVGIVMIQRHRCIRAGGWTRQQRRALGRLGMYFSVATTSCSTHPQSHGEEEGDIHEILYQAAKNRPSRRTSDCNCNGSKSTRPLLTKVYWKLVMWDVLNIAMYAIPAYIVLFMISIL